MPKLSPLSRSKPSGLLLNAQQRSILLGLIEGDKVGAVAEDLDLGYSAAVMHINRARERNKMKTTYQLVSQFTREVYSI